MKPSAPESPAKEQPGEQSDVASMVKRLNEIADGRWTFDTILKDCRKAAALLAKLGQGWIPVSERLPEEHVEVLAYHQWKHRSPKSVRASWYKHSDGTVCWVIETTTGHPDNVPPPSHWMPLPPPPERP